MYVMKNFLSSGFGMTNGMYALKAQKIFFLLFIVCSARAMVYDNRFFPQMFRPYTRTVERPSDVMINVFWNGSNSAFTGIDDEIGIPELFGMYDQNKLAQAMTMVGLPNLLRPEWIGRNIPWHVRGRVEGAGVVLSYDQQLWKYFSFGFASLIMRSNSWQEFLLKRSDAGLPGLTDSDILELDEIRRQMHTLLALDTNVAHQRGWGDTDIYVRVGNIWEYILKCRRVDAGFRVGALVPSGVSVDPFSAASVPFGGNGNPGIYLAVDTQLEIKEDFNFGLWFCFSKRFAQTRLRRMPVNGEPSIFGAVVGPAQVDPGPTVIFSPYLSLENFRGGLGGSVQYTLARHWQDDWYDKRSAQQKAIVQTKLGPVITNSSWGSDYITLNAFYDFGKEKVNPGLSPLFNLYVDIPTVWIVGERFSKSYQVTLGVELKF